jgi:hypothetical protein
MGRRPQTIASIGLLLLAAWRAGAEEVPPAHVVEGAAAEYRPLLTFQPRGVLVQVQIALRGRLEGVTDIPLDRDATLYSSGVALSPQLRLGALVDTQRVWHKVRLLVVGEADLPTGEWQSGPQVPGDGMPNSQRIFPQLRKAYAQLSVGRYFHVGGGFMMNQWGLGLIANDGTGTWAPGNAQFLDPRGGDRVLRGFVATGPLTRLALQAALAFDQVRGDDALLAGDSAIQGIGVIQLGFGRPSGGGLFLVQRHQTAADHATLDVTVADLAGRVEFLLRRRLRLKLEGEIAVIAGSTTLGPTPEHPTHQVLQVGAAGRATLDNGRIGTVWDFLFASGDRDYYDGRISGFKANSNYPMGILLFRYVVAAQTARSPITAGDPALVGTPNFDLDRIPTRGSASNTIAFYPKFFGRPWPGTEFYGGVLIAWAAVPYSDPFNTQIAGGVLRGPLDGPAGQFYGAEFDLGARYRLIAHGTQLTIGVEGASLLPGSAFRAATGLTMDNVLGGRVLLEYRL